MKAPNHGITKFKGDCISFPGPCQEPHNVFCHGLGGQKSGVKVAAELRALRDLKEESFVAPSWLLAAAGNLALWIVAASL